MLPSDVLEDIRKKVEGGLGPLTKGGSDDLAGALFGKAQGAADQLSGFASAIGEWVAFARELIRAEVRDVVERELSILQPVTSAQIESLIARVERLERRTPAADASRNAPGRKSGTKTRAGAKARTGGKPKRKTIARNLDALEARVERLERAEPSGPVRLRTAGAGKGPGKSAGRSAAAGSRAKPTRKQATSSSRSTSAAGTGAKSAPARPAPASSRSRAPVSGPAPVTEPASASGQARATRRPRPAPDR